MVALFRLARAILRQLLIEGLYRFGLLPEQIVDEGILSRLDRLRSERTFSISSVCFSSGIANPHFTRSVRSKGARAGPSLGLRDVPGKSKTARRACSSYRPPVCAHAAS